MFFPVVKQDLLYLSSQPQVRFNCNPGVQALCSHTVLPNLPVPQTITCAYLNMFAVLCGSLAGRSSPVPQDGAHSMQPEACSLLAEASLRLDVSPLRRTHSFQSKETLSIKRRMKPGWLGVRSP